MFDLAFQINVSNGKTIIVRRIDCSNRQMAVYITTAIMRIQRDCFEEIKKEGEIEKINLFLSKDKKEMKIETTLDNINTTYVLAKSLSQIITAL